MSRQALATRLVNAVCLMCRIRPLILTIAAASLLGGSLRAFALSEPAAPLAADTLRRDEPMIVFEQTWHDFGTVSRSKRPQRSHTFEFTNTGTRDLVILQAVSGCGCTTPRYTKEPVKPGKKGKLVVHYDATGQREGVFWKSITIYVNSSHSYTRIYVKGKVQE